MLNKTVSYPCFCTANKKVIEIIIVFCKIYNLPLVIESTSAQVNQMGGYSNHTPKKFKELILKICKKKNLKSPILSLAVIILARYHGKIKIQKKQ